MSYAQLTAIGAVFDILVCTFFALRLMKKYREDQTNLFVKLFIRFFWFFDIFLLCTLLYIPNLFIPTGSSLLGVFFCLAYLFLFVISAYAARLVVLVKFPNFDYRFVFWPIIIIGAIVAAYFAIFDPPNIISLGEKIMVKPNIFQTITMAVPVSATFIPAAIVFFIQAVKDKKDMTRSLLLGIAFALWLIGGSTHPITLKLDLSIISDVITSLGFLAAFIALVKRPRENKPKSV